MVTSPVTAYVLINCILGKEERVLADLCKLSGEIVEARGTYGLYDIFLKIITTNMDSLDALLVMVRKIDDLKSTITLAAIPSIGGKG